MVPEFEKALSALKPGEISPVIHDAYGYHIIRRPTYEQVKTQLLQASKGRSVAVAESTYLAKLEANGKIEVKKGAVATVRAIGNDPDAYRRDNTVLATSAAGKFTTARLVGWLETLPPNARVLDQIKQMPDSMVTQLDQAIRHQRARAQAGRQRQDSDRPGRAGAAARELRQCGATRPGRSSVSPRRHLQDSAKTEGDREKLAAKRINDYFDRAWSRSRRHSSRCQLPSPTFCESKYKYSFNDAGFDRAVEEAAKIRNSADSARTAGQPATAVPLSPAAPATPSSTAAERKEVIEPRYRSRGRIHDDQASTRL